MRKSWMMAALAVCALGASRGAQAEGGCEGDDESCAQASLLDADDDLQAAVQEQGIAAGFAAALDEDASYMITFSPLLRGKAAIVDYLNKAYPDASATLTWHHVRGDVSAHGDLGYTFGWTTFTAPGGKPRPGHYIAAWRREREEDGHRWVLESYLRHGAAVPPTPPPSWFGPVPPAEDVGDRINQAKAVSELEVLDTEFAALTMAQGQVVSQAEFAAPDAVEMLDDLVYGKDAIVASHAHDAFTLNFWPSGGGVARSGDIGFTIGRYVAAVSPALQFPGHYLTIWKRQPDGQWKYMVGSGAYSLIQ